MAPIDVILQHVSSETKLIPVIAHLWESPTGPSRYYLSCLIRRYVQQLEDEDKHCDDDTLMELIRQSCNASITTTDPEESCHQSFHLVNHNQPLLQIRVYPHHNNVALRLWPAAAALAEYILSEPSLFAPHDVVLETGAGVGLTGIVMAAATPVRKIVLTDYTATAVDNLRHNVQLNQRVVLGQDHNIVTVRRNRCCSSNSTNH
jgi:predicted nicotinamide N-methyase